MIKLSLKEKLLVSLYNGVPQGSLTYRPLTYLYKLFPNVNPGTIRVLISALKNQSLIEKIERNKNVYIALTRQGLASVFGQYLFNKIYSDEAKAKKDWDGFFSLAIINVPESKKNLRPLLRQILTEADFRHWQSGIWISPHALGTNSNLIEKAIAGEKTASYLTLVKAKNFLGTKSSPSYIYSLWNLAEIKKNYESLILESASLARMKHFDAIGYINLLEWEEKMLLNLKVDPLFPHNFYPLTFLRERAVKAFLAVSQKPVL